MESQAPNNGVPQKFAVVVSLIAFVLPIAVILYGLNQSKCDGEGSSVILLFFIALGTFGLVRTFVDFKFDYRFYSTKNFHVDSGRQTYLRVPGHRSGDSRFWLYYPFMFFVSTSFVAVGSGFWLFCQ
jgi:hypothetical protein